MIAPFTIRPRLLYVALGKLTDPLRYRYSIFTSDGDAIYHSPFKYKTEKYALIQGEGWIRGFTYEVTSGYDD